MVKSNSLKSLLVIALFGFSEIVFADHAILDWILENNLFRPDMAASSTSTCEGPLRRMKAEEGLEYVFVKSFSDEKAIGFCVINRHDDQLNRIKLTLLRDGRVTDGKTNIDLNSFKTSILVSLTSSYEFRPFPNPRPDARAILEAIAAKSGITLKPVGAPATHVDHADHAAAAGSVSSHPVHTDHAAATGGASSHPVTEHDASSHHAAASFATGDHHAQVLAAVDALFAHVREFSTLALDADLTIFNKHITSEYFLRSGFQHGGAHAASPSSASDYLSYLDTTFTPALCESLIADKALINEILARALRNHIRVVIASYGDDLMIHKVLTGAGIVFDSRNIYTPSKVGGINGFEMTDNKVTMLRSIIGAQPTASLFLVDDSLGNVNAWRRVNNSILNGLQILPSFSLSSEGLIDAINHQWPAVPRSGK